eukprot:761232-Hanusia_phi.AAC.4
MARLLSTQDTIGSFKYPFLDSSSNDWNTFSDRELLIKSELAQTMGGLAHFLEESATSKS